MKEIHINDFRKVFNQEKENTDVAFINVCRPREYNEKHIEGIINIPLDDIVSRAGELSNKKKVYLHCNSGKRSAHAGELLEKSGAAAEVFSVQGGLMAWTKAGFPTASLPQSGMSLVRQTFLTAGMIVLLGLILFFITESTLALAIPAFVGAGMVFSGLTGWCGMQLLLSRMPWNK